MSEPWVRKRGESPPAWQAFQLYRDAGPGRRSTAEVARKLGKSKALMDRWSSRWCWVARCREFDAHCDQQIRAELAAAELQTRRRHLRIGDVALSKALETMQNLRPGDLPPTALAHLLRVAAEMQRQALATDELVTDPATQAVLTAIDRALAMKEQHHV